MEIASLIGGCEIVEAKKEQETSGNEKQGFEGTSAGTSGTISKNCKRRSRGNIGGYQRMNKKQMLIEESKKVISAYTTKLTLRQIYYRLVAKHIIPNTRSEYKYLSRALVDARLNGAIPWARMEDKTRDFSDGDFGLWSPEEWHKYSLNRYKKAADRFSYPYWYLQRNYVEVWCEKEALENLFLAQTRKYNVVCGVCRGYPSIAWLRQAAVRIEDALDNEDNYFENATVLYFGDFDPSGKDIERNIRDRLQKTFEIEVSVERIAITQEHIKKYNIPPMPTKTTDARAKKHISKYGAVSSVELDAIEPNLLQKMISDAILSKFDKSIPATIEEEEEEAKETIRNLIKESLKEE